MHFLLIFEGDGVLGLMRCLHFLILYIFFFSTFSLPIQFSVHQDTDLFDLYYYPISFSPSQDWDLHCYLIFCCSQSVNSKYQGPQLPATESTTECNKKYFNTYKYIYSHLTYIPVNSHKIVQDN